MATITVEAVLVGALALVSQDAGAHSTAFWVLTLLQFPGTWIMSAISFDRLPAPEALAYYLGVFFIQCLLLEIVAATIGLTWFLLRRKGAR